MPLWTLLGLMQGKQTAPGRWRKDRMARTASSACRDTIRSVARTDAERAPTFARRMRSRCGPASEGEPRLDIDYGRCVVCQLCTEACPTGAMAPSTDWAFGARTARRSCLGNDATQPTVRHWTKADADSGAACISGTSMPDHATDASRSCKALNNPFYNLHRLGIFFTASPRFADLLLVTGPVTYAMLNPLRATYEAMPEPRWVMAVGTCAVSGGMAEGGYSCGHGLEGVLPVDVYLPGCPPNPAAIIHALMMFLERVPQRVKGGQLDQ